MRVLKSPGCSVKTSRQETLGSGATLDPRFMSEPILTDSLAAWLALHPSLSLPASCLRPSSLQHTLWVGTELPSPRGQDDAQGVGGTPPEERSSQEHVCSRSCFQMLQGWAVGGSPRRSQKAPRSCLDTEKHQRRRLQSSGPRSRVTWQT